MQPSTTLPSLSAMLVLFFALAFTQLIAQGDLFLSPTRIIFEGSDRSREVLLVNTGQDSAVFAVSFIEYHIDESGNYLPVSAPDTTGLYASRFVRFYPRKFTLGPGASQTLRMQYLPKPGMPQGEYRSHLFFRMEPKVQGQPEARDHSDGDQPLSVKLIPIYGVTIPVLIREGNLSSDTEITDIRLDLDQSPHPLLEFAIRRNGDKSTLGDLSVDYLPHGQKPVNLRTWKGVSLYTPSALRKFSLALEVAPGLNLREGTLLIRYGEGEEAGEALSRVPLKLN